MGPSHPLQHAFVLVIPWAHTELSHSRLLTFTEIENDQSGLLTCIEQQPDEQRWESPKETKWLQDSQHTYEETTVLVKQAAQKQELQVVL